MRERLNRGPDASGSAARSAVTSADAMEQCPSPPGEDEPPEFFRASR